MDINIKPNQEKGVASPDSTPSEVCEGERQITPMDRDGVVLLLPLLLQLLLHLLSRRVGTVVLALDFEYEALHLGLLATPLLLAHLGLFLEKLHVGLAVAAAEAIPEGGELTVAVYMVSICIMRVFACRSRTYL